MISSKTLCAGSCHFQYTGTPSVLEPFYTTNSGPKSEQFAVLTVENILFAGSQLGGQHKKTNLQFSAQAMVDVLEYKVLSLQKLVSPFEFSGIATIQPKPKVYICNKVSYDQL